MRTFEITEIEAVDDLGSDHLPMISTLKFNNNKLSNIELYSIINLYHKLDKNHAANLLSEIIEKKV